MVSANVIHRIYISSRKNTNMKTKIEWYVIDKVKDLRESKNMSQALLADVIGVSNGFIGKVESKSYTNKYNLNHINLLAKYFKCAPADFLPKKAL